jgi:phospholipid transport system transporter-binding protein
MINEPKRRCKRDIIKRDHKLIIDGEISFATIPKLRIIGCKFISEHQGLVFDLEQATTTDISGLALLIAWTRFAKQIGKSIQFINLPKQLLDMAKLNGLKDLLPIG